MTRRPRGIGKQDVDVSTLGGRVRWARRRLDMSTHDLARKLSEGPEEESVAQGSISRYESGEREIPAHLLIVIGKTLGVAPEWLLTGIGPPEGAPDMPVSKFVALFTRMPGLERAAFAGDFKLSTVARAVERFAAHTRADVQEPEGGWTAFLTEIQGGELHAVGSEEAAAAVLEESRAQRTKR